MKCEEILVERKMKGGVPIKVVWSIRQPINLSKENKELRK